LKRATAIVMFLRRPACMLRCGMRRITALCLILICMISTLNAYLGDLHFTKQWRKGIGRFLCKQAENMLVARGHFLVTLGVLDANDQAKRLDEAMKFEADGGIKQLEIGASLEAIRYCKKLKNAEPPASSYRPAATGLSLSRKILEMDIRISIKA